MNEGRRVDLMVYIRRNSEWKEKKSELRINGIEVLTQPRSEIEGRPSLARYLLLVFLLKLVIYFCYKMSVYSIQISCFVSVFFISGMYKQRNHASD